jgi:acetoacetate decarboxylase
MKLDPSKIYVMPQIMGAIYDRDNLPRIQYPKSETVAIQFRTEGDVARELVPDCYQISDSPLATVVFAYHQGLDFMAGGGYNLATVQIEARFDGERDHIEGDYILVMFENDTKPILGGRDHLGVPKIFADIPPIKYMQDGSLRCEASVWGHLLFGLELPPLKKQNPVVKTVASKRINSRPWLAYKYIPSLDGPPDADYPTTTRNDIKIDKLWMGKTGRLYFGNATTVDISETAHVMDALKSIPVGEMEQALHFKGSVVLRFDQSGRLQ